MSDSSPSFSGLSRRRAKRLQLRVVRYFLRFNLIRSDLMRCYERELLLREREDMAERLGAVSG